MSYRYEKNSQGNPELVIDGFENGIAQSPYKGIGNIANLNINYYEGVAYVNYKRKAATISGATMGQPVAATQSPSGLIYISDASNNIFKQNAVNGTTFTAIGSNPGTGAGGILWWNNYLLAFRTSNTIDICGDGSGDSGITSANWNTGASANGVWPIDTAAITLNAGINAGDTTASMTTTGYTDAQGTNRKFWNGPTGTYLASLGGTLGSASTQIVYATMTQGSGSISWTPAATAAYGGSMYIYPLQNGNLNGFHPSLVSRKIGNAVFTHQNFVGTLSVLSNYSSTSASGFVKTNFKSFQYNGVALALPNFEQVQWVDELANNFVVGGNFSLYPWDGVSQGWTTPIPVQEGIQKFINVLNNLYVFAGNKGNIYIYNGYSVARFAKIPDYIAGVIDPTWAIGGLTVHRQKLFFQATAANTSGTTVWAGIFSLNLDTGAICMENQNSFGTGSSVTDYHGLLIDNEIAQASTNPPGFSTNYDSYYSAWYNNSAGGIDYNDTTLYQSGEPFIETDIIPVGTAVNPKTWSQAEFKLDRPLANGDSISIYVRSSLSDSYTLIGTTTATSVASTQVLAAMKQFDVQKQQWSQFKITFSCASSNSSRIPLREVRIR